MFPLIGFSDAETTQVHLKVTSVVDFADVWRLRKIEGEPGAPYRRVCASKEGRHGAVGGGAMGLGRF
jgi:hypothetical protein